MKEYSIIPYEKKYFEYLKKLFLEFITYRTDWLKILKKEQIFKNLEEYLVKKNVKAFLSLSEDKKCIWFIFWYIKETNWLYTEKRVFWNISHLFVSKEFRWKWISTKLKSRFIEFMKEKDINELRLKVYDNNKKAQEIYKKWWFNTLKIEMNMNIT